MGAGLVIVDVEDANEGCRLLTASRAFMTLSERHRIAGYKSGLDNTDNTASHSVDI